MGTVKQERTAGRIHKILSEVLLREMSDPRLLGTTVTEVKLDRELRHANIYVGAIEGAERERDVIEALEHAHGFLRREIAQRMRLRSVPQLHFHWDPTIERAERLNQLFDEIDVPPAEEEAPAEEETAAEAETTSEQE